MHTLAPDLFFANKVVVPFLNLFSIYEERVAGHTLERGDSKWDDSDRNELVQRVPVHQSREWYQMRQGPGRPEKKLNFILRYIHGRCRVTTL